MNDTKPLAFIDIDGVLNRFCSNSQARKRKLSRFHGWGGGYRWPLWLDSADRGRIRRLSEVFECAWGTTWEHEAHEAVAVPLGLPRFEVVAVTAKGESTKEAGIVRAAAGRPFVWFDDVTSEWGTAAQQPHLVVQVEPTQGLTDEHIDTALAWWGSQ